VSAGSLTSFLDALTALEQTVDRGNLRVYRWRPAQIETPAVYNWLLPSPSEIPAAQIVTDTLNFAVRVVVPTSDIEQEASTVEAYFDKVRDTLDADLIEPSKSTLRTAAYRSKRTTSRTLTDGFNEIPFMALELVIQTEFRRAFSPT